MTIHNDAASFEAALRLCASREDVRILRRVRPISALANDGPPIGPTRRIAIVDTETTSVDVQTAEVIEIAAAVVLVDDAGEIRAVEETRRGLRDPGIPIPGEVQRLTGLSDDDVAGRGLNVPRWEALLGGSDLIVAHNSAYDAPIVERLLPGIKGHAWACSMREIDWAAHGFDGAKLGHLLMQIGYFTTGHRADADVISLAHLLTHRPDGEHPLMAELLARAAQPSLRFEATGAPFDKRHLLKARGYRWDAREKVWWREIAEAAHEAEALWLARDAELRATPRVNQLSWNTRYR
ncbi:MAG: DNA polymerase III subunit epsilon [Sphingopyxis sp.]|nr:DNA polymerase III subunit epsilon [Sphingopyxis sp.]